MAETPMNTHTLYTHFARLLQKANDDIAQTRKYLDPDSPHYLPAYLENMESLKNSEHPPAGIEEKIITARANFESYQQRAAAAQQVMAEYPAKLKELEASNNVFLAPPAKLNEYIYVMDEESCQASCVDWAAVAAKPGQEVAKAEVEQYRFKGTQTIELDKDQQTDAVRVWTHNACVEGLNISDQRSYEDAHRDAIQLIPPALGKREKGKYIRLADQMAGTVMENVTVQACTVNAPHGPLQGIFASDGLQRQLRIIGNDIRTLGAHSISIAGLLDGGEISGNVLREVMGGATPKISLYPARIGGNMADDGVVCILAFATEDGAAKMDYAPVTINEPNMLILANGTESMAAIDDSRTLIPDNFLKLAVGLTDFHYHAYLEDYGRLTLGEYRAYDPFGAEKLEEWLTLRTAEFANGRDSHNPLGQPGSEQQAIGERFLAPALKALQAGSVESVRLVDLEYTAIRSFAMKRLAILHSKVAPLINIALLNPRRELMLGFLLEPAQLTNVVSIACLDADMECAGTGKPVPYLKFRLFFDGQNIYQGSSDADGHIALKNLPLGSYIMQLEDAQFSLTTQNANPVVLGQPANETLAQSLLADFRNKWPIVDAYLQHDARHAQRCLNALQRQLASAGISKDAELSADVRRDCLTAMGLGVSRREPYRQTARLVVNCPQVSGEKTGCLFFIVSLIKKLLGKS